MKQEPEIIENKLTEFPDKKDTVSFSGLPGKLKEKRPCCSIKLNQSEATLPEFGTLEGFKGFQLFTTAGKEKTRKKAYKIFSKTPAAITHPEQAAATYTHNPPTQEEYAAKAKKAHVIAAVFWFVSLFLLICMIIVPPLVILLIITLIHAFIFRARRRKFEILARVKANPTEEEKERDLLDKQESDMARRQALYSLLFLSLCLTGAVISGALAILIAFDAGILAGLYLLYLLLGLGSIAAFLAFLKKARVALDYGQRVLKRHPKEKYYPARRRALLGKRIGILSYVLMVPGYIIIGLFVLISILLLAAV